MPLYGRPHVGHEKHLCEIIEKGATFSDYFDLIRNAKFVCKQCGRAATKEENLCDPFPIPASGESWEEVERRQLYAGRR